MHKLETPPYIECTVLDMFRFDSIANISGHLALLFHGRRFQGSAETMSFSIKAKCAPLYEGNVVVSKCSKDGEEPMLSGRERTEPTEKKGRMRTNCLKTNSKQDSTAFCRAVFFFLFK